MEIEHILGLRMFSIQGLACGLVPELHSQTKIELDSFIICLDSYIASTVFIAFASLVIIAIIGYVIIKFLGVIWKEIEPERLLKYRNL